jgi:hypothetical protein
MTSLSEHQFFLMIKEIFDPVIQNYGFELNEENENLVIATKGDIQIIFRLESAYLTYYFSLEIKLSGELGRKATPDSSYRHLGVAAIAQCLDQNYSRPIKKARNEDDLKEIAGRHKEELIRYCERILLGDVASWQYVVDCLKKKPIGI